MCFTFNMGEPCAQECRCEPLSVAFPVPEEEGGENDGNNGVGPGVIAVFHRDAASGKLTHSGVHVDVPQAVCVTAVRV